MSINDLSKKTKGNQESTYNLLQDTMLLFSYTGLVKNQRLEKIILTPTTKEEDHDVPISLEEVSVPLVLFKSLMEHGHM